MMIQLVSVMETKTTLDVSGRKGFDVGNWLRMPYEYRLELRRGRGLVTRDLETVAIRGASARTKKKEKTLPPSYFPFPVGGTPAGNQLARASWKCSLQAPWPLSPRPGTITDIVTLDLLACCTLKYSSHSWYAAVIVVNSFRNEASKTWRQITVFWERAEKVFSNFDKLKLTLYIVLFLFQTFQFLCLWMLYNMRILMQYIFTIYK